MFYVIVMYNVHLGIQPVFTGSYLRSGRIRIRAGSNNFTGSGSGAPVAFMSTSLLLISYQQKTQTLEISDVVKTVLARAI